jgi:hypothetical protein
LINTHHSHVSIVTRWSRSPTALNSTLRTWLCLPNCPLCCWLVVILLGDGWGLFLPCCICSVIIKALRRCCRPRLMLIFGLRICPPLRPLLSLRDILKFITTIEPSYSRNTGKPLIRTCGLGIFDEICRQRFGEVETVMQKDCMWGGNWWDRLELPNYFSAKSEQCGKGLLESSPQNATRFFWRSDGFARGLFRIAFLLFTNIRQLAKFLLILKALMQQFYAIPLLRNLVMALQRPTLSLFRLKRPHHLTSIQMAFPVPSSHKTLSAVKTHLFFRVHVSHVPKFL